MNDEKLSRIIRPLAAPAYSVSVFWKGLDRYLDELGRDYGSMDLCPDFQRGHVWTGPQKKAFIESALRQMISDAGLTLQFNCPEFEDVGRPIPAARDLPAGVQCLDGLQRITAVREFLGGEVFPFGLHVSDLGGSRFDVGRSLYRFNVAIYAMQTRAEVLQHYIDINAGGTPHSSVEINRVRGLLNDAMARPAVDAADPDLTP